MAIFKKLNTPNIPRILPREKLKSEFIFLYTLLYLLKI
jgi:hypothetical protein